MQYGKCSGIPGQGSYSHSKNNRMSTFQVYGAPNYCFFPGYDEELKIHQVCLLIEGMDKPISTTLTCVTGDNATDICDRLNARLGHSREEWTRMAAQFLDSQAPGTGKPTTH